MSATQATKRLPRLTVHQRWTIRKDMEQVLAIEETAFDEPWTEEDFRTVLRCRNNISTVAEHDGVVVGFIVYQLAKSSLTILNIAVREAFQRRGVATAMLDKLARKLSEARRKRLVCNVTDGNLEAHLFLKAYGFKATNILRDFYGDGADAYHFTYKLRGSKS